MALLYWLVGTAQRSQDGRESDVWIGLGVLIILPFVVRVVEKYIIKPDF